jgi:hypothetical protein
VKPGTETERISFGNLITMTPELLRHEATIRLAIFLGIFAVMSSWE